MTIPEALAILELEIEGPIGVSISREGGDAWLCFRFAEMAHPYDATVAAQVAVALETLVQAAKDDDLITRESLPYRIDL